MKPALVAMVGMLVAGCGTEVRYLPGTRCEIVLRIYTPPYQDAFDGVSTLRMTLSIPGRDDISIHLDARTSELSLAGPPAEEVVLRLEGLSLDGQEIIASGQSPPFDLREDQPARVDLLFARRGEFARLLGDLGHSRFGHTASALPDGRVLVFGGGASGTPEQPAGLVPPETYAVASQTSCLSGDTPCPAFEGGDLRTGHAASIGPQDTVFIFGGEDQDGKLEESILLFDPATGLRAFINYDAKQVAPRAHHAATGCMLDDGGGGLRQVVLFSGGEVDNAGQRVPTANCLLFDVAAGSFARTDLSMVHARRRHTATAFGPDRKHVLIAGGEAGAGLVDAGELFDGVGIEVVAPSGEHARNGLLAPRVRHNAVAMPGGVMIAGGDNQLASMDEPEMFLLDGAQGTGFFALDVEVVPADHPTRRGAVATWLDGGEMLIAGGEQLDGFERELLATAESLQVEGGTRRASYYPLGPLGQRLSFPTVTRLPGGALLITGGLIPGSEGPVASGQVWYYNP